MGDARAPLRRLAGTATPHSCPGGGCWTDSAGEAPGRWFFGAGKKPQVASLIYNLFIMELFFPGKGSRERSCPDFGLWGWETGQGVVSPPQGPGTCCAALGWSRAVPSRTEPAAARRQPRPGSPRAAVGGGRAERGARRGTSQHGSALHGSARLRSPAMASKCPKCDKTVYFGERIRGARPRIPFPRRDASPGPQTGPPAHNWRSSLPSPSLSPGASPFVPPGCIAPVSAPPQLPRGHPETRPAAAPSPRGAPGVAAAPPLCIPGLC